MCGDGVRAISTTSNPITFWIKGVLFGEKIMLHWVNSLRFCLLYCIKFMSTWTFILYLRDNCCKFDKKSYSISTSVTSFLLAGACIDLVHLPNPVHMMGLPSGYADAYAKDNWLIEIYQGDRHTVKLQIKMANRKIYVCNIFPVSRAHSSTTEVDI